MSFLKPRDSIEEYKLRAIFRGIDDLTGGYPFDSVFLNNKILEKLNLTSSQLLVDIGCGNGYLLDKVKEKIFKGIGVCPSREECDLLKKKFVHSPAIEIQNGTTVNLSFIPDLTADIVICNGVLLYLKDLTQIEETLKEINRICKKNAIIFIGCVPEKAEQTSSFYKNVMFSLKKNSFLFNFKLFLHYVLAVLGMKMLILPSSVIYIDFEKFSKISIKSGFSITENNSTTTPPGKWSYNYSNRRDYWMRKD